AAAEGRLAAAQQGADLLLERVVGKAVPGEGPAVRAARREEARMLARAVVAEPALGPAFLRAVLEVVDGCSGPGEQTPDGLELSRLRLVRRACDRELVVVEVVVGIGEC